MAERGFRSEIQALRAVAVLLVLGFHLVPRAVPGGYVGVDVFFVISGFLITSHLAAEAVSTGTIRLDRFWARRIRRLVPAATVVLLASFVAMLWFVPRSMWQQTVTEIGASALYVQNWVLGSNAVDYLASENEPSIVQHYWSLSVEEQFYIVWPVVLLLAMIIARRRATARAIVGVLVLILVGSLAYSIVQTATNPALAYFNTGTRAWEFAAGGLLAMVPAGWGAGLRARLGEVPATLASWSGLAMIAAAALLLSDETPFPGVVAALPVAGALLVIAGGSSANSWSPQSITRFGPLQFVGDLSYSIYLWHWPLLIVATSVLGRGPGWKWALVIVGASIALAWLTKVLVEDPVRFGRFWNVSRVRSFALGAVAIGTVVTLSVSTWTVVERGIDRSRAQAAIMLETQPCFGAAAMVEPGCEDPFAVPAWLDTAFASEDGPRRGNNCGYESGTSMRVCLLGELEQPAMTVAIVGNSHASHYLPALVRLAEESRWKIIHIARQGCLGVTTEPVGEVADPTCLEWSRDARDYLAAQDLDLVIFPSHRNFLTYTIEGEPTEIETVAVREQIAQTYKSYLDRGIGVVVIGNTPGMSRLGPECVDTHRFEYDPCASARDDRPAGLLTEVARETPGVVYIDPTPWFCTTNACHALIGGVVVYSDRTHLTGTFSASLAPYLRPEIERALAAD